MTIVKLANYPKTSQATEGWPPAVPYFLTGEKARRHGVEVGQAVQEGILNLDDLLAVLANCRSCRENPLHERSHADATAPLQAPDYCANRHVLEGLRGLV